MAQRNDSPDGEETYHIPVLVDEVVDWLDVEPGGRYVDGTLGGGGHSLAILKAGSPDARVLGIDRDPDAIDAAQRRLAQYGDRMLYARGNYADAPRICRERGFGPVDGLLIDAGVSSHQFDTPSRGFSFRYDGPLDMRMGPEAERVDQFLDRTTAQRLGDILKDYGELGGAHRLAGDILEARRDGELETTGDLLGVVESSSVRTRGSVEPAVLVFQALRIAVNDELRHLREAVELVPKLVRPDGRAVFISFHSLEDRIVKHGLRRLATDCVCPPDLPVCGCDETADVEVLTKSAVEPGEDEVEQNPRARSARLRAARVLNAA